MTTNTTIKLEVGMNHIELEKIIIDAECDQDGKTLWYKETKKRNGEEEYKEYDDNGNEVYYKRTKNNKIMKEIHREFDEDNKLLSETNDWGQHTTYTYDELGREIHHVMVDKYGKMVAQLFTEYDENGKATKYISDPNSKTRAVVNKITETATNVGEFTDSVMDEADKIIDAEPKHRMPWWGKLIIVLIIICNPITSLVVFGVLLKAFPYIVVIMVAVTIIKAIFRTVKKNNTNK